MRPGRSGFPTHDRAGFVWPLLRRGYTRDLRIGGFVYAFLLPAMQLIALLFASC